MIKTEIIGFGQKINRTVKLVALSDTLTQYRRRRHGRCRCGEGGGTVQECFFCPSYFLSPYFSKYTNDETLKTNFKFQQIWRNVLPLFFPRYTGVKKRPNTINFLFQILLFYVEELKKQQQQHNRTYSERPPYRRTSGKNNVCKN